MQIRNHVEDHELSEVELVIRRHFADGLVLSINVAGRCTLKIIVDADGATVWGNGLDITEVGDDLSPPWDAPLNLKGNAHE